jgi:hypothetical protein
MRLRNLLIAALGTAAMQAAAAAPSVQPEFHRLASPQSAKRVAPTAKSEATPVVNETRGTLRADGSVELRCEQHASHAHDDHAHAPARKPR